MEKTGIEIVAEGNEKFLSDVGKSNKAISDLEGTADKASKGGFASLHGAMGKLGDAALGFGKVVGGIALGGAVAGVGALGAALVGGIGDAREAAKIFAQSESVIKSTGGAAGVTAQQVADFGASLSAASGKSLFGDSQIQESENLLLTFTNIKGSALEAATAMSVDMAQALGGAPKDAAIQLGKALNDPINGVTALSRVGVSFTDQQKAQIATMMEAGDVAGAQGVILGELNKEFGGSAEAAAKADGGMAMFKDRMGELAESVGAKVLPALNGLMGWLNSPEVQAGITALVDGLVNGVTKIGEVIGSVVTAFQEGGLAGVFDLVLPKLEAFGASVLDWIGKQAPAWLEQLATWGAAFAQWVVDALPGLMEKLGTLWQSMVSWVMDNSPKWAAELLKFGLAAVEWITAAMGPLADKLGAFANKMINWVVDQLPGWGKQLAEFGEKAVGWVLDALPGLATNLGVFAGKLIGWILQTVIDIVPKLAVMGAKFVGWVVTDVLPKLPGALAKIWDALVLFVQTAGKDIVPKLTEMAQSFLGWVEADVLPFLGDKLELIKTTIGGWISGAVSWAANALKGIGSALVQGLIDGINSVLDSLKRTLSNVTSLIPDWKGPPAKDATLLVESGQLIMQGLASGIQSQERALHATLAGITAGIGDAGHWNITTGGAVPMGGRGTVSPPASAAQQYAAASYSSIITNQYNYAPSYGAAPNNPSQDFYIMQALAR